MYSAIAPRQRPGKRPGFTLIELLVVLAIIAILVSLVAGGIFRAFNAQKGSNTEQTLTKLTSMLQKQWSAVAEKAKQEQIPDGIVAMAAGHPQPMALARVIWVKYRLKLEFPTSYQEALNPFPAVDAANNANPFTTNVPVKSPYASDLTKLGANAADYNQSSIMLLLALQRKRSGTLLNIEDLGSSAVVSVNTTGLKQFIDGWGNPLFFTRWVTLPSPPWGAPPIIPNNPATPATIQDELDGTFPGKTTDPKHDPLDPQGLLLNPNWNNQNNYNNKLGVYWFEQIFHPVHIIDGKGNWIPAAAYMPPVISSAGPNETFGDDDDLWSFRLRAGAKGDK
jgi:prepilin-type N-terminal cleavage/methylation domain-containing protein